MKLTRKMILIASTVITALSISTTSHAEQVERVIESTHFDNVSGYWLDSDEIKVYVADLSSDAVEINQSNLDLFDRDRNWKLSEKEQAGLNNLYVEAMTEALGGVGNVTVANSEEDADVTLHAILTRLNPLAPRDDLRTRQGSEKFVTRGAGSATIEMQLKSGDETLLYIEDRRNAGHSWGMNNRFSNRQDVKRLMRSWANSLAKTIDV